MVNGPEELPPEVDLDAVDWDWIDWSACGREVRRLRQNRPSGLLEPYAATSGTYGSEGGSAGQPAGPTRQKGERYAPRPPSTTCTTSAYPNG